MIFLRKSCIGSEAPKDEVERVREAASANISHLFAFSPVSLISVGAALEFVRSIGRNFTRGLRLTDLPLFRSHFTPLSALSVLPTKHVNLAVRCFVGNVLGCLVASYQMETAVTVAE